MLFMLTYAILTIAGEKYMLSDAGNCSSESSYVTDLNISNKSAEEGNKSVIADDTSKGLEHSNNQPIWRRHLRSIKLVTAHQMITKCS